MVKSAMSFAVENAHQVQTPERRDHEICDVLQYIILSLFTGRIDLLPHNRYYLYDGASIKTL